ncbi:hypothetical protein ILYODFUR_009651, partial [Ilyodon furcidens]
KTNPAHPPPTNNQRLTRKYSPSSWTIHQCRSSVCSVLPGFASFLHTTPFSSKTEMDFMEDSTADQIWR